MDISSINLPNPLLKVPSLVSIVTSCGKEFHRLITRWVKKCFLYTLAKKVKPYLKEDRPAGQGKRLYSVPARKLENPWQICSHSGGTQRVKARTGERLLLLQPPPSLPAYCAPLHYVTASGAHSLAGGVGGRGSASSGASRQHLRVCPLGIFRGGRGDPSL